jgi:plasmid stability protein
MSATANDSNVITTIQLPRELLDEMRRKAARDERSMAAEMRLAFRRHLALAEFEADRCGRD